MNVDPICGMSVPEGSPHRAERDGRSYYFCCAGCRDKFLAADVTVPPARLPTSTSIGFKRRAARPPANSLNECCHAAMPKVEAPINAPYFCPMCPGAVADVPGDCPKCGMALERNPAAAAGVAEESQAAEMRLRLIGAAALSAPLLVWDMAPMLFRQTHGPWIDGEYARWGQGLLAAPVVVIAGAPIFRRGARSLVTRRFNMWTLLALGVAAAFGLSLASLIVPAWVAEGAGAAPPVYFESAAVIVTLVLLGQTLEARARMRAGNALRALLDLAPPTARRVTAAGDEVIPLSAVARGDRLRVRPGDRIPVDGRILEGESEVDASTLTGESLPVVKKTGDSVSAGCLNGGGSFILRADRIGRESLLGQIVELVAAAQRSRAPAQALADRVAAYFVPVVVGVAMMTFAVWLIGGASPALAPALVHAVSVLVVACPCALGLATPMSITVGIGRAARAGILFRNAEALERLGETTVAICDKTGTLTAGRPRVVNVQSPVGSEAGLEALRWAAAAEVGSQHPLAAAIVKSALDRRLAIPAAKDFRASDGGGVTATVEGRVVAVGRAEFLRSIGVVGVVDFEAADAFRRHGQTAVCIALDGRVAGWLAISDTIKPGAAAAVSELRSLGLEVVMATGDHPATAAVVAKELGIETVAAGLDPAGKAALVREWRARGARVAMLGDGVNDAPALALADVGVAMGPGSDIALQTAGVTLISGDLNGMAVALRLSRAVTRNIRQNLAFAFGYNLAGVAVAAGVLHPWLGLSLNPMIAGAAMSLSSVSVIGNALRLGRAPLGRRKSGPFVGGQKLRGGPAGASHPD